MELFTSCLFMYFFFCIGWLVSCLVDYLARFLFMDCRQDSDTLGRLLTRFCRILYDLNSIANIILNYQLCIQKFKLREIFVIWTSHICIRTLPHIPVSNYEDACSFLLFLLLQTEYSNFWCRIELLWCYRCKCRVFVCINAEENNKNCNPTVQETYLGEVSLPLTKFCYCVLLIRNTIVGVWDFREKLPLRSIRPWVRNL